MEGIETVGQIDELSSSVNKTVILTVWFGKFINPPKCIQKQFCIGLGEKTLTSKLKELASVSFSISLYAIFTRQHLCGVVSTYKCTAFATCWWDFWSNDLGQIWQHTLLSLPSAPVVTGFLW